MNGGGLVATVRRGHPRAAWRGASLTELLAALAVAGLGLATVLPNAVRMHAEARAAAGARVLAQTLHGMRWRSVASARGHGLAFRPGETGWSWLVVQDGNGNGLRTAEVASGTDPVLSGPHDLERAAGGAQLGFPGPGPFPRIPPSGGTLGQLADPVKFGSSNIVAFTPLGTSSSGSLYVTDGRRALFAVVLYGRSGRIRVWRYDLAEARWTH